VAFGVAEEGGGGAVKGSGFVEVVAVEPGEDVAGGCVEALGNRIVEVAVGPLNQAADVLGVALENAWGIVGGTAIDDDVFEVGVVLTGDAEEGLFEKGCAVEVGCDDGDTGPGLLGHGGIDQPAAPRRRRTAW
jgi:hypothetical protein